MTLRTAIAAALLCLPLVPAALAQDRSVDLELVLAVDVSGSMDPDEKLLQRSGYIAAFSHSEVIGAVTSGEHRRIAVTYVEWAGPAAQSPLSVRVSLWPEEWSAEAVKVPPTCTPSTLTVYWAPPW